MQGNQLFGTLKSVFCREVYYIPVLEGPLIGGFTVVTAVHNYISLCISSFKTLVMSKFMANYHYTTAAYLSCGSWDLI